MAPNEPDPAASSDAPAAYAGKLCCVAQAGSIGEADILRATLQAEDIEAYIDGENAAVMLPHLQYALHAGGGLRLLVRENDLGRARAALEGQKSIDIQPAGPVPRTPEGLTRQAVGFAVAGIAFAPLALGSLCYAATAIGLARTQPPANRREYRRNLWTVLVLALADVLVGAYIWLQFVDV